MPRRFQPFDELLDLVRLRLVGDQHGVAGGDHHVVLEATTAGSKIARSETTSTIDWMVDRSPISGMNCLGRLSRDSGQTRVPEPPHIITGWILLIDSPRIKLRRDRPSIL